MNPVLAPTELVADLPPIGVDTDDERLVWAATGAGLLDGAWWPTGRNVATELRTLVPLVSEHLGGAVTRVSLNIGAWDGDRPRRLLVRGGLVRLGWFHTLDAATVTLARGSRDRVTLVVIPPDRAPSAARRLLRELSATASWPDSASAALSAGSPDSGTTSGP